MLYRNIHHGSAAIPYIGLSGTQPVHLAIITFDAKALTQTVSNGHDKIMTATNLLVIKG